MQRTFETHETPSSSPLLPLGAPGLATDVHALPFHASTKGCHGDAHGPDLPTAMHCVGPVQDSPIKSPPCEGLKVGVIAHVVPFQLSANVCGTPDASFRYPTAWQLEELAQTTPWRSPAAGFGLATTDHALPFQVSISVWSTPDDVAEEPTATQLVRPEHETPLRKLANAPRFGLGVTENDVPFHTPANVRGVSAAAVK